MSTMKNGRCSKCAAETIHLMNGNYADMVLVPLTSWTHASTQYYVCATCGYLEIYVKNSSELQEVAKRWAKVPLGEDEKNRHRGDLK